MSTQPIDREEVFHQAAAIQDPQRRAVFLRDACDGDLELQAEIEELLRHDHLARSFLEHGAIPANQELASGFDMIREGAEQIIGCYKLREQIGEGGFGLVFVAEQYEPVRRQVALKIIKPGMATKEVVARFEAERQALAMMDHPNIARVLDGGATDDGHPFFVMELVHGTPITTYCDRHNLTMPDRLQLFLSVCRGVHHAHQRGIIHRDIKPSNVLVSEIDGIAVPKVIDFGVAKAVSGRLTEKTIYTKFSQMISTPLYMSPEQAETGVADIDARTDVYALGVLLYELLTGSTPFDGVILRQTGFDEVRRIIREQEPRRPSASVSTLRAAALSTLAGHRGVDPHKLAESLSGELDWLVMKALEKDAERRYESVGAMAADIERYLNDEPVVACPPSLAYRFRKYARRHTAPLVASAAAAVILISALIVSSTLAAWAVREKGVARLSEQVARQERAAALDARALAKQQEQLAEQQRDAAEYDAYVANIQLAQRDWDRGDSLFKSLADVAPQAGRPDFRGWEWSYLFSQAYSQRYEFPLQAKAGISHRALAWAPDGKSLATLDETGLINIWNIGTGQLKMSLRGCRGNQASLAWSPNGKYLAAGMRPETNRTGADIDRKLLIIWDVESGNIVRSFRGHSAVHIEWHPDNVRIAVGGMDASINILNRQTGATHSSWLVAGGVFALDWHPDGVHLLTIIGRSLDSRDLQVWDTAAQAVTLFRPGAQGHATFSPKGSHLAFIENNRLSVVDFPSNKLVASFDKAYSVSWSPDGRRIAAAQRNKVSILDVETSAIISSIRAHDDSAIFTTAVAWSPEGEFLATSANGEVKVWDISGLGDRATTLSTADARTIAFSPNGKRLLVRGVFSLQVWDLDSGQERKVFDLTPSSSWLPPIAWSPDGKRFAATEGTRVVIRSAETGEQVLPQLESKDQARSIAFSPDGMTLAVGYEMRQVGLRKGRVRLFDSQNGEEIVTSSATEGACLGVAWSPDGTRLAATSFATIRVWDSRLRDELVVPRRSEGPSGPTTEVAWSPDGKRLAASFVSGDILIYDATTWTPVHHLEGRGTQVHHIAWHSRAPRLASGDALGVVRIWDTMTGREVSMLDAHDRKHVDVAWSSDGLLLASVADVGDVYIWDGSAADRYRKRHGDLRGRVASFVRHEKYQHAVDVLQRLCQLHAEEEGLRIQLQRVQWLRAMKLAEEGQVAEALEDFERLSAESANVPDYRLHLPGRMFDAKQYDEAIAVAEKFVGEFPEVRDYRDELGFLYESRAAQLCQARKFEEAIPVLRKLSAIQDQPEIRGQLAYQMAQLNHLDEMVTTLERVADAFGGSPDYRPTLARRFSAAGEHALAASIYGRLAADHSDVAEYNHLQTFELTQRDQQQKLESARDLLSNDKLDEAIELLRGLELDDPQHPARGPLGYAYLGRARKWLERDQFDVAIDDLSNALEFATGWPKDSAGYELALAQLADGRVEDYRATCSRMLKIFGDSEANSDGSYLASTCVLAPDAISDFSVLIAATNLALRRDSESVDSLTTLGALLFRAGEYDEAIMPLTQASVFAESVNRSSPGYTMPAYTWYFLSMAHDQLGQVHESRRWFDKANEWTDQAFREDANGSSPLRWSRRLTLRLLRGEAQSKLDKPGED